MGSFSDRLFIKKIAPQQWEIIITFHYVSDETGLVVTVPSGFVYNQASIPKIFQSFISKVGYYDQPAAVHDWLYYLNRLGTPICTRKQADLILKEGCKDKEKEFKIPWYKRKKAAIYAAVRAWGWLPGLWTSRRKTK